MSWEFDAPGWWRYVDGGGMVKGYVARVGDGWTCFKPDRRTPVGKRYNDVNKAKTALARGKP